MIGNKELEKPNISVMVPVYNGEKTLALCLDSVLNQTINDYEVIVVDNNSTDKTADLIKKYANLDKRIKYVFGVKRGRGSARNSGIKNCNGDIVIMTDADCIVPKNWIETLTDKIINESEAAVMGFEFNLNNGFWSNYTQMSEEDFYKTICEGNYIKGIDTKNFAIKKEVFKKNSFNENISSSEDLDFYLSIKDDIKIRYLPDIKVGHLHKDTFLEIIMLNIRRGYWTSKVEILNTNIQRTKTLKFNSSRIIRLFNTPISYIFYKIISVLSWKIGSIFAKIYKNEK